MHDLGCKKKDYNFMAERPCDRVLRPSRDSGARGCQRSLSGAVVVGGEAADSRRRLLINGNSVWREDTCA
jgi:hypothetical protein